MSSGQGARGILARLAPPSEIQGYAFGMASFASSRVGTLALVALCLGLLVGACNQVQSPTSSASSGATPGASGAAACQASPPPAGDLEGWPSTTSDSVIPNLITSPIVCGPNRVLFSFIDADLRPIAAPDRSASFAIYDLGREPESAIATVQGEFIWAIEDSVGVYVANVSIPTSGQYGAEFVTAAQGGPSDTIRMRFDVQPSSAVVKVGDRAPASVTPTLADVDGDISRISTDDDPEPAFYETSVDEALAEHEPFVLIFATPKFCQTAQCGPTLDRIKPFVARYPTVTFINVEPYKLKVVDGALEPELDANGRLQTTPTVDEWHLVHEPIVYVVDREGTVQGAFELIFGDAELTAALDTVK